jgi:vacuolar-type H+-ATPase subunit F/Vma7
MGTVAAIGEQVRVAGFALAGVTVFTAEAPDTVRKAWRGLPEGVELVILTPSGTLPLIAVMPS